MGKIIKEDYFQKITARDQFLYVRVIFLVITHLLAT